MKRRNLVPRRLRKGRGLPAAFSFGLNLHRVAATASPAVSFRPGLSNILPAAPEAFGRLTWEDVG